MLSMEQSPLSNTKWKLFPGKPISMFALENMDCFSGDLVFPAVLFAIQFSSVFPDYLLIILIFHSYFPVVICDLTKLQQ